MSRRARRGAAPPNIEFELKWKLSLDENILYKVIGIKRTLLTGHSLKIRAKQNGNVSSSIKWRVSDSRIARIRRGKLIGVKSGSVELTARAHSGVTKKLRITVISKYPDSISFDGSVPTELYESESATLNPVISDALNKSLKWSTSSKSVAKINSKGKITALKAGTVTIKAAAVADRKSVV